MALADGVLQVVEAGDSGIRDGNGAIPPQNRRFHLIFGMRHHWNNKGINSNKTKKRKKSLYWFRTRLNKNKKFRPDEINLKNKNGIWPTTPHKKTPTTSKFYFRPAWGQNIVITLLLRLIDFFSSGLTAVSPTFLGFERITSGSRLRATVYTKKDGPAGCAQFKINVFLGYHINSANNLHWVKWNKFAEFMLISKINFIFLRIFAKTVVSGQLWHGIN